MLLGSLAGCSGADKAAHDRPMSSGGPPSSALYRLPDSLAPVKTLVGLLRAQLTAKDPLVTEVAIDCEVLRLVGVLGLKRGEYWMHAAFQGAYLPGDDTARTRIDSARSIRTHGGDEKCDSLAKAGVLGGTYFPKGPAPP
jgi:hypothetical protein